MSTSGRMRMAAAGRGGGPTITITDAFNRADNVSSLGTADTGQTWSALRGVWGISTNTAYTSTTAGRAKAVVDTTATNHTVTVTLSTLGTGGNGVVARCADDLNYYYAEFSATSINLYKVIADTATLLTSSATANTNGDRITLQCNGSSLTVLKNGSSVLTTTDSSLTAGTKVGMMTGSASSTTRFDNFSATSP